MTYLKTVKILEDGLHSFVESQWNDSEFQFSKVLLQPLQWCCVDCVIHHERDVREE